MIVNDIILLIICFLPEMLNNEALGRSMHTLVVYSIQKGSNQ